MRAAKKFEVRRCRDKGVRQAAVASENDDQMSETMINYRNLLLIVKGRQCLYSDLQNRCPEIFAHAVSAHGPCCQSRLAFYPL